MTGSKKIIFEELDLPSREYLLAVGGGKGTGFPGVYGSKSNPWWCFFVLALFFLMGIPVVNFLDTFAEPKAQALLQTALFLVGGWFVLLSFRQGGFFSGKSNPGCFVFIDGKYCWNCNYNCVRVTNIEIVKSIEYTLNEQFKTYAFKAFCGNTRIDISVSNEESAAKLYSLLFYKSNQRRDFVGGDDCFVLDEAFRDPPIDHVPDPFKVGKEKFSVLGLGIFSLVLVIAFNLFLFADISFRDDQIWQSIHAINTDEKIYWLRIYLRDERNSRHRIEAIQELGDMYKYAFQEIAKPKDTVDKDHPLAKLITVPDPRLIQGLQSLVLPRMLDLKEPLFKLSVVSADPAFDEASKFGGAITDAYIHSIVHELGREYFILSSSLDGPGHITIVYGFSGEKEKQKIRFEVQYRQSPESETFEKSIMEVELPARELQYVERAAKRLGVFTVGDHSGSWEFPKNR